MHIEMKILPLLLEQLDGGYIMVAGNLSMQQCMCGCMSMQLEVLSNK